MLSPGPGLGAQASAVAKIKDLQKGALEAINLFPQGSREQQALLRVAQTLSVFTKEQPGPGGGVDQRVAAMNAGPPPGGPPGLPGGPPGMPPPGMPPGGPEPMIPGGAA